MQEESEATVHEGIQGIQGIPIASAYRGVAVEIATVNKGLAMPTDMG